MVAIETATVIKISISLFGVYFQVVQGCKVWIDQIMEENVIRNWNLSNFLSLTTLTSSSHVFYFQNLICFWLSAPKLRPRLLEYVFIENDIVFNENATIVLYLHIVFISFQPFIRKRWKRLKTVKTSGNLLFVCQDNLNNLWLLLYRFQKFAFPMKTIRPHDNDIMITISFSNLSTLETVFKSYRFQWQGSSFLIVFDRFSVDARWKLKEKFAVSMKTIYPCKRGLRFWYINISLWFTSEEKAKNRVSISDLIREIYQHGIVIYLSIQLICFDFVQRLKQTLKVASFLERRGFLRGEGQQKMH